MKTIRAAIFSASIVFAAGAFAIQYPSGNSSLPQAQPQAGQPSQTSPQPAGAPSIDDQVRVLAEQLSLSKDQQANLKSALEDQHAQAVEIIQDNSIQRENKIMKIHAVRETTINRVRTSLNDDQKKKFDQIIQQQDTRMDQQMHPQPGQQTHPKQ